MMGSKCRDIRCCRQIVHIKSNIQERKTVHGRNRLSRDFVAATLSVEYTRDIPLHIWLISKISYNQLTSSTFSVSRKAQEICFIF